MLIKEYRITMPMSVAEYQIGQLHTVLEASLRETGGGEGVEILKNEPFTGKTDLLDGQYTEGQYTYKVYHLASRLPSIVKLVVPKGLQEAFEESWNAYPYCRTIISNPNYLGEKFFVKVETMHCADRGEQENVHGLPPELLKKREVVHIDIANDPVSKKEYKEDEDPKKFKSEKTKRGPLTEPNWRDTAEPVMTCYKLVTCLFKYSVVQGRVESYINSYEKKLFFSFHRQVFCSMDRWHGKTLEDIRRMEQEIKLQLDELRRNSIPAAQQGMVFERHDDVEEANGDGNDNDAAVEVSNEVENSNGVNESAEPSTSEEPSVSPEVSISADTSASTEPSVSTEPSASTEQSATAEVSNSTDPNPSAEVNTSVVSTPAEVSTSVA